MSATYVMGGSELLAKIEKLRKGMVGATAAACYQFMLEVDAASARLVPVDTGRLRASRYVELPKVTASEIVVRMGYGTSYALPVHERTNVRHEHGQAKFLSQPFKELSGSASKWIAAKAKENFANGVTTVTASAPTEPPGGGK